MAEYRDLFESIRLAGAQLAAIAVDEPATSEALRQELQLPFLILCDTSKKVISAWGIFRAAKGGIAQPSVFVVDPDLRVRFHSVDKDAARVPARTVVDFLLAGMQSAPVPARRRIVFPSLIDCFRAARNTLRRSFTKDSGKKSSRAITDRR